MIAKTIGYDIITAELLLYLNSDLARLVRAFFRPKIGYNRQNNKLSLQSMDEDSKALWQRIDEHTKEIAANVMEIGLIKAQLKRIEGDHSYICQTLKKTEDRLVIMIEAIVTSVNEIKLQNAERAGSEAATKQSINWGLELLRIVLMAIPICATIIVSYPHK